MPTFRIVGVDRSTGLETELAIEAQTAANARAIAECREVIVTEMRNENGALLDRRAAKAVTLAECNDCGASISRRARACPHCGATGTWPAIPSAYTPAPSVATSTTAGIVQILAVMLLVLSLAYGVIQAKTGDVPRIITVTCGGTFISILLFLLGGAVAELVGINARLKALNGA